LPGARTAGSLSACLRQSPLGSSNVLLLQQGAENDSFFQIFARRAKI
jgi:hypothetical protein